MHKLAQPVKLWYLRAVLPPGEAAGRALPPVLAGRRRGDRLRRPRRRRRADRAAAPLLGELGVARRAPAPRLAGHAGDARRLPRESSPPTCARTRTSCRRRSRARIDLNPLRAFDAKRPRHRRGHGGAPRLIDELDAADAEHFDEVCARAGRRGDQLRDRRHARARPRLLHAHDLRVHLRRAGRAVGRRRRRALRLADRHARRPADARHGLGRRRRADAAGRGRAPGRGAAGATSTSPTRPAPACRPSRWPTRRARPGWPCSMELAGARSRASSSRPTGSGARYVAIVARDDDDACATWTPASRRTLPLDVGRGRPRPARAGDRL